VVILQLGANDGLRGLPPGATRENLARMVRLLKSRRADVLLVGIQLPPNYGPRYATEFGALYQAIAARERVALVPFLLDGVATERSLMQDDNLHPNERGQPRMLENVWPRLRPLLRSATRQHKAG
jgi:acyl-CoA thioesterase-1